MVHPLYWVAALTYAIVLGIILRQAFVYRDVISPVDNAYRNLLSWCIFFCLQDALWGIAASKDIHCTQLFFASSTLFHISIAVTAFFWLYFVLTYLKKEVQHNKLYKGIGIAFLVLQFGLVISNFFTPTIFEISAQNEYIVMPLRKLSFFNQYILYLGIGILTAVAALKNRDENRKQFVAVFFFVLAPILCGGFQLMFPEGPFYSIGYLIGCIIIHVFIVSKDQTERLVIDSITDELTQLFNRRSYEEDFKRYRDVPVEDDFIIFSIDINGLKQMNDSLGHDVGDELITGSAKCITNAFAGSGKVYRVGGDEFMAVVYTDNDGKYFKDKIIEETLQWKGEKVKEISLSIGYAAKRDFPELSLIELKKTSDKMMYKDKDNYYKTKGIDRRGQREAFNAICKSYTKILKINLTTDSYGIIQMNSNEKAVEMGFSEKISEWLHGFGKSGQVHPDDLDEYLSKTDINYLRGYFKNGCSSIGVFYRRREGDSFRAVMMEMLPAEDYSNENQSLFLYVKDIGNKIVYA